MIEFSVGQELAAEKSDVPAGKGKGGPDAFADRSKNYAIAAENAVSFTAGTVAAGKGKGGPEASTAAVISAINSSVSDDKQGKLDFF